MPGMSSQFTGLAQPAAHAMPAPSSLVIRFGDFGAPMPVSMACRAKSPYRVVPSEDGVFWKEMSAALLALARCSGVNCPLTLPAAGPRHAIFAARTL